MSNVKRKIHAFNFKGEGAHVSLVDKAANLQEVLTMKAAEKEVTFTTDMRTFLSKFFGMWSDDAAVLAGVLGYSTGLENETSPKTYEEYIKEKIDSVQLLKGLDLNIESLPESIALKVQDLMKEFGEKVTSEDSPLGANNLKGDSTLSEVKIDAKELEVLKAAAARVDEIEILKAKADEADKLKSEIETLKSERAAKIRQEMTDVVKGYTFIDDKSKEPVVDFLLKAEDTSVMLEVLEKAREAISAAVGVGSEVGTVADGDNIEVVDAAKSKIEKTVSSVQQILAKRKS